MGDEPLVRLRDVRFAYPSGTEALRGVDLDLWARDRVALLGENGSGKTTLARILLGLAAPSAGTVRIGPHDPARGPRAPVASWVGLVFQNPDHQLFGESVREEVAFGPRQVGLGGDELDDRVSQALARFGLTAHGPRRPTALSGGERKRVALAATDALLPRVLLLDEPTKGTDYGGKRALVAFGKEVAAAGRAVVFITHDTEFALEATERTVVLHRGRVFRDGPTREVLADPAIEEARLRPPALARLAFLLHQRGYPEPFSSLEGLHRWLEGVP